MSHPSVSELKALACSDCPADVTVQRGKGVNGPALVVYVVHADSCPWCTAHVPVGGATIIERGALLRHVRACEPDVPTSGV